MNEIKPDLKSDAEDDVEAPVEPEAEGDDDALEQRAEPNEELTADAPAEPDGAPESNGDESPEAAPTSETDAKPAEASDAVSLRLLEAILFASPEPITERALAKDLPDGVDLSALIETLRGDYAVRGVNLVQVGDGWAFRTAADLSSMLASRRQVVRKMSRAAVETLAILAYHQPATRAEIEAIRGVGLSQGTLDILFEAGWIKPRGRRRTPGRPVMWGTTDAFLDHFGIATLDDLPGLDELKASGLLDPLPTGTEAAVQLPIAGKDDELPEPAAAEEDADVAAEPLDSEPRE
ncbi:MAG: SMC-Scp complex subunit ScpB [Rhodospirillales bacterium]|nr:SMC-Scp complex subunit ScpB [Rhodospirillales bacterium]